MDYQLSVKLRNSIAARAHMYGADALILEKQADALVAGSGPASETIERASSQQRLALSMAQEARRRYFRELEAVDLMGGHSSAFAGLG